MDPSTLPLYASVDQLRASFDRPTFLALFDDDNAGAVADANPAVVLVLENAHSEIESVLSSVFAETGMPKDRLQTSRVSTLLVAAELAYAKFFAYERKPALAAKISPTFLTELFDRAQQRADRIKNAVQEIPPAQEPPPAPQANVGGVVQINGPRMTVDAGDGGPSNFGDY